MTVAMWAALVTAYVAAVGLFVAWWIGANHGRDAIEVRPWFDHQRFTDGLQSVGITEHVRAFTRPASDNAVLHPCSYGGELFTYPVTAGWDEDAILGTLAEIEAL